MRSIASRSDIIKKPHVLTNHVALDQILIHNRTNMAKHKSKHHIISNESNKDAAKRRARAHVKSKHGGAPMQLFEYGLKGDNTTTSSPIDHPSPSIFGRLKKVIQKDPIKETREKNAEFSAMWNNFNKSGIHLKEKVYKKFQELDKSIDESVKKVTEAISKLSDEEQEELETIKTSYKETQTKYIGAYKTAQDYKEQHPTDPQDKPPDEPITFDYIKNTSLKSSLIGSSIIAAIAAFMLWCISQIYTKIRTWFKATSNTSSAKHKSPASKSPSAPTNPINDPANDNESYTKGQPPPPDLDEHAQITKSIQDSFSTYKLYNEKLTNYYTNVKHQPVPDQIDASTLLPQND
jgi:hypothetical protein